jgi:hypothetical protein
VLNEHWWRPSAQSQDVSFHSHETISPLIRQQEQ